MTQSPVDRPEAETIERAISGDVEAFGELYDRYLDPVFRFVRFQVGDQADAEDLTETVFLKAFEGLPAFQTGRRMTNFRAWIYRIARNLVIDHYRTHRPSLPLDPVLPSLASTDRPEEDVQFREQSERIRNSVEQLDEPFRPVIVMRFVGGLSYRETADALGLTENYVRVIQFRALKMLRALLEE